jgi:hypothetical protein
VKPPDITGTGTTNRAARVFGASAERRWAADASGLFEQKNEIDLIHAEAARAVVDHQSRKAHAGERRARSSASNSSRSVTCSRGIPADVAVLPGGGRL